MQVQNVSPSFTARPIIIPRNLKGNDLESRPFLYNEVMDVLKKQKLPSVVSNKGINVPSPTPQFIDKLLKLGIKFQMII